MMKAVILDCDGVILDSAKLHLKACNDAYAEYGINFGNSEYFSTYSGLSDKESLRMKLESQNIEFDDNILSYLIDRKKYFYIKNLSNLKKLPFVPGVEDFIKLLVKEHKVLGVCSGSSEDEVLTALSRLDNGELIKYFQTIVTIDDINNGKPSPEGYTLACKNICLNSSECLAIEDSPAGVEAAISAGLSVYALLTTHNATQLQQATKIYKSFNELLKLNKSG